MFRGLVTFALALTPVAAQAQCPTSWTWHTGVGGSNLSPVGTHPHQPHSFVASPASNLVEALDDETGARSSSFEAPVLGGGVENYLMVVRLSNSDWRVFAAARDGYLYAIDAVNGDVIWAQRIGRPTCASDILTAAPAIVRRSICDSYAACQMPAGASNPDTDIVVIGTRFGCGVRRGEVSDNKVVALRADTGWPVWAFNTPRTDNVDYIAEGPAIDYERNRLFVGTGRRRPTDNSLFALDIATGTKLWARNVGRTETVPKLSYNKERSPRLYVATLSGTVHALDPETGADVWSPPTVSVGAPVSANLSHLGHSSVLGDRIFAVSPAAGTVSAIRDDGGSASVLWTLTPAGQFSGALAKSATLLYEDVAAGVRELFVGMGDGTLRQIGPANAETADEIMIVSRVVDAGGSIVGDPIMDLSAKFDTPRILIGDNAGFVSRWCVPW